MGLNGVRKVTKKIANSKNAQHAVLVRIQKKKKKKKHVVAQRHVVALESRACNEFVRACAKFAHDVAPGLPKSSALRCLAAA